MWIEKGELQEVGPAQEVVGNYYAASHDALPVDDNEIGQRWGSGEVSISKIQLLNQNGVAQRVFQTGERLAISIDYTSQMAIPSANVSVGITHLHGTGIWGTSTEKNSIKVPVTVGPNSLRLELASLPLLNGTYDLTIAITDQSGVHEFDHWEKRVRFDVNQGDIYDIGLIDISSSWTINS